MSRKMLFICTALCLTFALAACARSSESASDTAAAEAPREVLVEGEADFEMMEEAAMDEAGFAQNANQPAAVVEALQSQPQERLIIRDANLELVVNDTEAAIRTIAEMAESNGGWVVSSNVFQYDERAKTGSITVRVPASGFQSALEAMKGLAVEVQSESTSGQDVTDEFVDLSLRLQNLEATADRVRSFLDEAKDVEDALAVNMELSRLEGEIERIKGRIEFLSQSATYSTITVQLTPDVLAQPIEVGGWQPEGVAKEAVEALISALQGAVSAVIWLGIYVLPLLLLYGIPLLLIVWLGRRVWRRMRRNRIVPQES